MDAPRRASQLLHSVPPRTETYLVCEPASGGIRWPVTDPAPVPAGCTWPPRVSAVGTFDLSSVSAVRVEGLADMATLDRPNIARMYDYMVGGSHNFRADRAAVDRLLRQVPDAALIAQANRAFLSRAVRHLVDAGIRQFIDIGAGLPTRGNVHEVARRVAPDSRVVYVDIDPVAVAHSRSMLAGDERATAILGDLRRPQDILCHEEVTGLIDLSRPTAILMVAVLHFVDDGDDPRALVGAYRDALVPGGHLVISHATADTRPVDADVVAEAFVATGTPLVPRSRGQVRALLDGLDVVDPGVCWLGQWRPDAERSPRDPAATSVYAAVGRR
jgi:SAM-dependent methyltransferase